jgi:hypothetical protein
MNGVLFPTCSVFGHTQAEVARKGFSSRTLRNFFAYLAVKSFRRKEMPRGNENGEELGVECHF